MKKLFMVLLIVSTTVSCNKSKVKKGTPDCVKDKITEFDKSSACNNAKVDQYTFQGNTVYAFEPGSCGADMATEVISSDCKTLGYLGGFSGNTKINGSEFSTAKFENTVWKK